MEANPPSSSTGIGTSPAAASSALPPPAPKILLAKPGTGPPGGSRFPRDDDSSSAAGRTRSPSLSSLNLLSPDSWDFHTDRALPFLTENTDFTVIGVIGLPGVGKSTILNELYGFDGTSPGMLPPFGTQSEEIRAMARHCTTGIEMRVSMERLILLDTQPVFSPSVLADMMRPDGSSSIPVLTGETVSADLAHELMGIQLGVFLSSVCHMLLVVSEGVHDTEMWQLMLTVDLLKHAIPDPSMLNSSYIQSSSGAVDRENKDDLISGCDEFLTSPIFVHSRLQDHDFSPSKIELLRKAIVQYFKGSSFGAEVRKDLGDSSGEDRSNMISTRPELFLLPLKDDTRRIQYQSYGVMMGKLRDRMLSVDGRQSFAKTVSEREWVRNAAKIWDMVKKSSILAEYGTTLQRSGLFRK